jgi:hypothetical protein
MAKPLSTNASPARSNNGHGKLSSLAANLALAPAADDLSDVLSGWDDEPAPPPAGPPAAAGAAADEQLARAEKMLADLKKEAEQALLDQQAEFERILEEKSGLIRELHLKVQELEQRPARPVATPREEELMALSEELERERQQLKEDEDALMEQMGQMEVQMSRERAELARQRTELQRLQGEIRHELELAARDAALRERLAPLQRRHQEMTRGRGPAAPEAPAPAEAAPADTARPGGSGIFRRLFG